MDMNMDAIVGRVYASQDSYEHVAQLLNTGAGSSDSRGIERAGSNFPVQFFGYPVGSTPSSHPDDILVCAAHDWRYRGERAQMRLFTRE